MDRKLVSKIDLEGLRSAFAIAEETLEHDLAVIRISLVRDVHYDSLDLYVTVFGKENDEEDAPVAEYWVDPYVLGTDDEFSNGGVEASRLRDIFSEDTFHLILGLNVLIQWLCDGDEMMTLSLFPGEDLERRLLPIDQ